MPDYKAMIAAFTDIYTNKVWGGGSGASSAHATEPYIQMIRDFMKNNSVKSVVDMGCGDWQFSQHIDWTGISYRGFDVVESVIESNKREFGRNNISFDVVSRMEDLPEADLLLCKDVLQHLQNGEVNDYLDFFSKNFKFSIITNDIVPDLYTNVDIPHGGCRAVRLDLAPFNRNIAVLVRCSIPSETILFVKDAALLLPATDKPVARWKRKLGLVFFWWMRGAKQRLRNYAHWIAARKLFGNA